MSARLRLIAGPNGSGKTTLTASIREKLGEKFGIYLNADEIEQQLREHLTIDFSRFGITPNAEAFSEFYNGHALAARAKVEWTIIDELFTLLAPLPLATYFPTLLADFIREQLLAAGASFAFETVMSDAGKIDLLKRAQECSYRTYLYYVCVEDPSVNIDRVADRVTKSGHSVPTEKIIDRYQRSLINAVAAIPFTSRAYFWDNSGTVHNYLAEITDASIVDIVVDEIPYWFEAFILNRL